MQNRNNVRLTDEAHALLKEKATNLGQSMKEVVSEAVLSLFKRELKYNEYIARIKWLEKEVDTPDFRSFFLGIVAGGILMFAMWVVIG